MNWNLRNRALVIVAFAVLYVGAPRPARAADVSVTVIDLEAKGVDATVADLATDDLGTALGDEGIAVVSNETLKAELKRRGISQTCGVDDCPVAFDKIVKSTHLLRGSLFQIENRRVLKVTVDTVSPRKQIFSGRREFERSDTGTTAAVKEMGGAVITCLKGGSCKDNQPAQIPPAVASVQASPAQTQTPAMAHIQVQTPALAQAMAQAMAQLQAQTQAQVAPPAVQATPVVPEMIAIPSGEFVYGDDGWFSRKQFSLPAFKIDKTEVTVAAYAKCVQAGKCSVTGLNMPLVNGQEHPEFAVHCNWGKSDRSDHPLNCVDWNQAKAYCDWSGKRLPTEREWEKAARGTDGRTYPWGEQEPTCDRAIWKEGGVFGCGKVSTWPVCSKPDGNSPYGLCDMAGNVTEWTADWNDDKEWLVLRGGSWCFDNKMQLRTFFRDIAKPTYRLNNVGFRCAQ